MNEEMKALAVALIQVELDSYRTINDKNGDQDVMDISSSIIENAQITSTLSEVFDDGVNDLSPETIGERLDEYAKRGLSAKEVFAMFKDSSEKFQ
ncbi:hypothetical protein J0K78_10550 [Halobacillus sp. GSS1]|uniref:hypothetical protein n=1 Tax=Halobacillus sp. GSS1 TaxID=2815919 RepID=UPI001A90BD15|nr:hypothetical protein [Halobacillus sp. GSS1]MBN9654703.1 hypothetical protein [Halobacillus sp. GSS1]